MANFVFNIAKGRVAEFYNRVKTQDPSTSRLIVLALATSGLEADSVLIDKDDVAALVSGATNEVTNVDYARKTLTNADLAALSPNDGSDLMNCDIPDQTFVGVDAGDGWSKLVIAYDGDIGGGTDANVIPLTCHDFVVTPDGNDIVARFPSGFFQAA